MHEVARTSRGLRHHNTLRLNRQAKISFILYTEADFFTLPDREFRIEGSGLELSGRTDREGKFEFAPVVFAEFDLLVGDARFRIPSILPDDPPHPVNIPYDMLPDLRDAWRTATGEEIRDDEELNRIESRDTA